MVHRPMWLDGFIAGFNDAMDWIFEYVTSDGQSRDDHGHGSDSLRPTNLRGRPERRWEGDWRGVRRYVVASSFRRRSRYMVATEAR